MCSPVAIRNVSSKRIVLVDMDCLNSMAKAANVRLHNGTDPDAEHVDVEPILKKFKDLKTNPEPLQIHHDEFGHQAVTYWIARIRVRRDFLNRAGRVIHRMKKDLKLACGADGQKLNDKLAKFVLHGGDTRPESRGTKPPTLAIKKHAISECAKTIRYRGRNGVEYSGKCEPGQNDIQLKFTPVGVKQTDIVIRILRTQYVWSLPDWDERKISMHSGRKGP